MSVISLKETAFNLIQENITTQRKLSNELQAMVSLIVEASGGVPGRYQISSDGRCLILEGENEAVPQEQS